MTLLDLKNAEGRANWTRRYFSGHFCDDLRTPGEQVRFAIWYQRKLKAAHAYLRGSRGD